jgi:predicted amidohydrolase YtcJ
MIQNSPDLIDAWLARGPEIGDYLTVRAIKLIADGALGSRGAALLSPYADDPANRGLLILDRAFIRSIAKRAIPRDFQVNTHAIGDRANHETLLAYGWFPDQRMSREEALRSFTIEGAYAAFEERKKGSLVPGKLADLVMLSGDPMKVPQRQMLQLRVTMTIVGGRIVYREP